MFLSYQWGSPSHVETRDQELGLLLRTRSFWGSGSLRYWFLCPEPCDRSVLACLLELALPFSHVFSEWNVHKNNVYLFIVRAFGV